MQERKEELKNNQITIFGDFLSCAVAYEYFRKTQNCNL
jgi:hypothetical protein